MRSTIACSCVLLATGLKVPLRCRRKDPNHVSGTAYGADNYSLEYQHQQVRLLAAPPPPSPRAPPAGRPHFLRPPARPHSPPPTAAHSDFHPPNPSGATAGRCSPQLSSDPCNDLS